MTGRSERSSQEIDGSAVLSYLQRHPDFLAAHPEVLEIMTPPQRVNGAGVVDLQHYILDRQRTQIAELEVARDSLLQSGRSNLAAQRRVHQAVVALLGARSFEHLIEIVTTDLAVMLNLDAVTLGVEQSGKALPTVRVCGLYQLEAGMVDEQIGPGCEYALHSNIQGDPLVFGPVAGLITSEALIRLSISSETPPALLAFGSRQVDQFQPGQGTELLGFVGRVVEQSIRAWLDLPA